nr:hypothetical protein [Pyxidicoccus fallax]
MAGRDWLAGGFSVADILMADVLRLVDRFDGLATHRSSSTLTRSVPTSSSQCPRSLFMSGGKGSIRAEPNTRLGEPLHPWTDEPQER